MFESSRSFAFFDYFRVPYAVRPAARHGGAAPVALQRLGMARQPGGRPRSLLWPAAGPQPSPAPTAGKLGRYQLRDITFSGHVIRNGAVPALLSERGHGWERAEPIRDEGGHPYAAIWQDADGSVFLPFDPGEAMKMYWSEDYRQAGRSPVAAAARDAAVRAYYLARPALPRQLQLRMRRAFTRVQARSSFPGWPIEDSLHALYAWLFGVVAQLAGQPVPFLDPWPGGRSWALVLTHDVETPAGCGDLELLRVPERELGYRSSWNFVPLRYRVADGTLSALREEGCEIGIHGLRHDGRDLGSRRLLAKRLPQIRSYADRWQAAGFRSPATQRNWEWMPELGFDYDSSYSDTDPYEPQPGGCCTYLPYFNQNMVELPITLPQDHTMFSILGYPDGNVWLQKALALRDRGAMVLVLTHPDYARDPRVAQGYRSLLEHFHDDGRVWHALPREVAAWWRDRAASALCRAADGWRIEGPASSRGRIRYATPESGRTLGVLAPAE